MMATIITAMMLAAMRTVMVMKCSYAAGGPRRAPHAPRHAHPTPVGSDAYKLDSAKDRVEEVVEALETAALMPELQLQHCLSVGSLIHRISHLLRNIPGGNRVLYQEVMVRYDTAVIDFARRVARQTMLPLLAQQLAALPACHGGLGYRTWSMTADAAFLAKYAHVSRQFKSLFPLLAPRFPDVLSLGSVSAAALLSPNVACAFRALSRIEASGAVVGVTRSCLHRDQDKPLRHLQHVLASISEEAKNVLVSGATAVLATLTTRLIRATWPSIFLTVVIPRLLPWSQPAQPPLSRTSSSRWS
jgi:hypothetical protein